MAEERKLLEIRRSYSFSLFGYFQRALAVLCGDTKKLSYTEIRVLYPSFHKANPKLVRNYLYWKQKQFA